MKRFFLTSQTRLIAGCFICAGLLVSQVVAATEEPAKKKKKFHGSFVSRNNKAVRIYPDIFKRSMHVVAKENEGKQIDFFVFDLKGTLVKNHRMKAKDHFKLTDMDRGAYVYRVFSGDEESAAGTFEIR